MRPHVDFIAGNSHIVAHSLNAGLIAYDWGNITVSTFRDLLKLMPTSATKADEFVANLNPYKLSESLANDFAVNITTKYTKCRICRSSSATYLPIFEPVCGNCINTARSIRTNPNFPTTKFRNEYVGGTYLDMIVIYPSIHVYKLVHLKDFVAAKLSELAHNEHCRFNTNYYHSADICQYCRDLIQQYKQIHALKYLYLATQTIPDVAQQIIKTIIMAAPHI